MRSLASFRPTNKSPVPFVSERRSRSLWNLPGRAAADYVQQMETYSEDGVVFPVVNRLMSATSSVEWKFWKKSASGAKEDRTEVTSHAVLDLLENPNPFMSRQQLMAAGQQHNDLTGETNLIVGYAGGVKYPIDLYPCRPDRLQPIPDRERFLAGWVYQLAGERVPLEMHEILRWIQPSPLDPYRGMGPIQSIMRRLNSEKYGQEWQAAFFQNSARPGGVIEVDRRLGDDEFNEMVTRWRDQHQGISKAHRVAVIENGAKWVDTAAFSMKDLQMAELSGVSRDIVLVVFGFPKAMLGIVEDVNRANAEAGEYLFARWLTVPRLDSWKGMFNRQLLPLFDKNLNKTHELDYESPVPENSEQAMLELEKKSAALVGMTAAGFGDAEVLELLNWPDLGYVAPPPPTIVAPPGSGKGDPGEEKKAGPDDVGRLSIDAAMRWVVTIVDDENACDPCLKQKGKLYRSRAAAYADYPGGKSYIKCVGEKYGNHCRCSVVKRKGGA